MPARRTLDEVKRQYNFTELSIATWRDPALSVHPARGGPGFPGTFSYKVNYDHLPHISGDEASEDEGNGLGIGEEVNIDGPQDSSFDPAEHDIALLSEELPPQEDPLDAVDSEAGVASEIDTEAVEEIDAESEHDNLLEKDEHMSATNEPASPVVEGDNQDRSSSKAESRADDSFVTPDDTSDDRRVSFAPGTPDPKPTPRKKKPAKGTKSKKKKISVPIDSLPADIVAIIDGAFEGQPPAAPDPPTDEPNGITLEEHEHGSEASSEDSTVQEQPAKEDDSPTVFPEDTVQQHHPPEADASPAALPEDVPTEHEAVEESPDVASVVDASEKVEKCGEESTEHSELSEKVSNEPALVEEREEQAPTEQDLAIEVSDSKPASGSPSPDSGIDIPMPSKTNSRKKSSKSSKDRDKAKKKPSKKSTKELPLPSFGSDIANKNDTPEAVSPEENHDLPAAVTAEVDLAALETTSGGEPDGDHDPTEAAGMTEASDAGPAVDVNASDKDMADMEIPPGDASKESSNAPSESIETETAAIESPERDVKDESQTEGHESPFAEHEIALEVNEVHKDEENPPEGDEITTANGVELGGDGENEPPQETAMSSEPAQQVEESRELAGDDIASAADVTANDTDAPSAPSGEFAEEISATGNVEETAFEGDEAAIPVAEGENEEEDIPTEVAEAEVTEAEVAEAEVPEVEVPEAEVAEVEAADDDDHSPNDNIAATGGEGCPGSVESTTAEEGPSGEVEAAHATVLEPAAADTNADINTIEESRDALMAEAEAPLEAPTSPKTSKSNTHRHRADSWKRKHTEKPLKDVFEHTTVLQRPHDRDQRSKDAIRVRTRKSKLQNHSSGSAEESPEERRKRKDARRAENATRLAEEERRRAQSEERRRARRATRKSAEAAARLEQDAAALEAEAQRLRRLQREAETNEGRPRRENKTTAPSFILPLIPKALNLASASSVHGSQSLISHGGAMRPKSSSGSTQDGSKAAEAARESKTASPPGSHSERPHRRQRHHRRSLEDGDGSSRRDRDNERHRRPSVDQTRGERPRSFLGSLLRKR